MRKHALFVGAFMASAFLLFAPTTYASQPPEQTTKHKLTNTNISIIKEIKSNQTNTNKEDINKKPEPKLDKSISIDIEKVKDLTNTKYHVNINNHDIVKTDNTVTKTTKLEVININKHKTMHNIVEHSKTKQIKDDHTKKCSTNKTVDDKNHTELTNTKITQNNNQIPDKISENKSKTETQINNKVTLAVAKNSVEDEKSSTNSTNQAPTVSSAEAQAPTSLPVTGGSSFGTIATVIIGGLITLLGYVGSMAYQIAKL